MGKKWTPIKLKLIFLGHQNYFIDRFFCNNIIICIRILVLHHVRVWLVVVVVMKWTRMAHRFIYGAQTCVHFAVLIGTWQAAISSLLLVCPHQNNYTCPTKYQLLRNTVCQGLPVVRARDALLFIWMSCFFGYPLAKQCCIIFCWIFTPFAFNTTRRRVVSMATHPQPILLTIFVYQGMQITCQQATVDGASLYPTPTQLQDNLNATMQFH